MLFRSSEDFYFAAICAVGKFALGIYFDVSRALLPLSLLLPPITQLTIAALNFKLILSVINAMNSLFVGFPFPVFIVYPK